MATKKVYFNEIKIKNKSGGVLDISELRDIYSDIFNKHSRKVEGEDYDSLSLSTSDNQVTLDILENTSDYLFCRVGKRKDDNSMLLRDYDTLGSDDVLTPIEALKKGVEIFTYFLLNYDTGIFSIVSTQSAPTEGIVNRIVSEYNDNYETEIISIPNDETVKNLYQAGSIISKVSIRLPIPNAQYLEQVLGLKEDDMISLLKEDVKELTLEIKGEPRKALTCDNSKIRNVINAGLNAKDEYNKVTVRGKSPSDKTQDYDLKSQLFSYWIDIKVYNIVSGIREYLSLEDLSKNFFDNLSYAYKKNETKLKALVGKL